MGVESAAKRWSRIGTLALLVQSGGAVGGQTVYRETRSAEAERRHSRRVQASHRLTGSGSAEVGPRCGQPADDPWWPGPVPLHMLRFLESN